MTTEAAAENPEPQEGMTPSETATTQKEPASEIFKQFQATYGESLREEGRQASLATVAQNSSDTMEHDEGSQSSVYDFLVSLVIPTLLQVFIGCYHLVCWLLDSKVLPFMLPYCTTPQWLADLAVWLGYDKANSWPPPTFLILAAMTILVLVVQPDGLTWILLQKLRDGTLYLVDSSSSVCWMVVHDYGKLVSSFLALTVFAAIAFLIYVLHKTLRPKPNPARQPVKHRKKKKKQQFQRNPRRSRSMHQQQQQQSPDSNSNKDRAITKDGTKVAEILPALSEDKVVSPPLEQTDSVETVSSANAAKSNRLRTLSASTEESTIMSDDQSIESTSGRSTPTMSLPVEKPSMVVSPSHHPQRAKAKVPRKQGAAAMARGGGGRAKKGATTDSLRSKGTSWNAPVDPLPTPTSPSRWDALQPTRSRTSSTAATSNTASTTWMNHTPTSKSRVAPIRSPGGSSTTANHRPPNALYNNGMTMNAGGLPDSFFDAATTSPSRLSLPEFQWQRDSSTATTTSAARTNVYTPMRMAPPPAPAVDTPNSVSSDQGSFFSTWSTSSPTSSSWAAPPLPTASSSSSGVVVGLWRSGGGGGILGAPPGLSHPSELPLVAPPHYVSSFAASSPTFPPRVTDNPFENDDESIEAELQELGGKMVGSILDF